MKSQCRWKKSDESDIFLNCPDHQSYKIYYARTKTVGRDWSYSDTNQLIHNLKKKPGCPANQLTHKHQAIEQFAKELTRLFSFESWARRTFILIPIPPSKTSDHDEFDNRLDKVAKKVATQCTNVSYVPLLIGTSDRMAAHENDDPRDVDTIYENIECDTTRTDEIVQNSVLAILDYVASSGASFLAAYNRLHEQFPESKIIGIFWAKAAPEPPDFDAVETE